MKNSKSDAAFDCWFDDKYPTEQAFVSAVAKGENIPQMLEEAWLAARATADHRDSVHEDAQAKAKEFMVAARNAQMFQDIRSVLATCADLKARTPYRHVEAQRLLPLLDAFLGSGYTVRVIEFKRALDSNADAARYRWLKENCFDWAAPGDGDSFDYIALHFEHEMLGRDDSTVDAAIDEEIRALKSQQDAAIESQRSGNGESS